MEEPNTIPQDELIQEDQQEEQPQEPNFNNEEVVDNQEQVVEQQDEQEEESDLTPRQQKRLDQVEAQAKEYGLNKILDRISEVRNSAQKPASKPQESSLDYRTALDAPEDVYTQLEQDRTYARQQGYNDGLEQAKAIEFRMNLKTDLPFVEKRLSQLDPADAEAIDREYLLYAGFDPSTGFVQRSDIPYADFVNAKIDMAERIAQTKVINSQKNIARQAAQVGVRPDGSGRQGLRINSIEDIRNMSADDFEKNRAEIYRQAGINLGK